MVVYEDILFPVRKVRSKPVQGCTTIAKVMLEVREKYFMVSCIKGCRKIPKQENRSFVINQGSEKIVEYAERHTRLCAVPEPVNRPMDAEHIVC